MPVRRAFQHGECERTSFPHEQQHGETATTRKPTSPGPRRFSSGTYVPILVLLLIAMATTGADGDADFWMPTGSGNDTTIPLLSAKEYLSKFGWVEPSDWTAFSPSLRQILVKRPTEANLLSRIGDAKQERTKGFDPDIITADILLKAASSLASPADATETTPEVATEATAAATTAMSDDRFVAALRSFQRANGLAVTGRLDEATSLIMQQPRCGVPDKITIDNVSVLGGGDGDQSEADDATGIFDVIISSSSDAGGDGGSSLEEEDALAEDQDQEEVYASGEEALRQTRSVVELTEADEQPFERTKLLQKELRQLRAKWSKESRDQPQPDAPLFERLFGRSRLEVRKEWKETDRQQDQEQKAEESKSRQKRSDLFKLVNEWKIPGKQEITWRLSKNWPSTNPYMTANEVWFTLRLAFRMWSEVLPRTFRESPASEGSDEYVDVLLGFAVGQHNECPATFDTSPYVHEYAHAWPLPWAQVHFNDQELFVPFSWQTPYRRPSDVILKSNKLPISLLKVALHEIGHALGLKHSNNRSSIMYPYYKPFQDREIVELSDADRHMVREIYGPCNTRIDSIFDMVFVFQNDKGEFYLKYNTFIFRRGWFWLYKNQHRRPQYGYPKLTTKYWRNVMLDPNDYDRGVDAVVQTREQNFYGTTLFFIGEYYAEYDMTREVMRESDSQGNKFPRRITDAFKGGPRSVDAAMFKYQEKLLYLFRGPYVYRYRWPQRTLYDKNFISTIFPIVSQPIFRRSYKLTGIDAAYYSLHDNAYYLIKGDTYWKVNTALGRRLSTSSYVSNGQRITRYMNPLGAGKPVTKKWLHVCDVGRQEIHMSLPEA